jgi:hypothetical protein
VQGSVSRRLLVFCLGGEGESGAWLVRGLVCRGLKLDPPKDLNFPFLPRGYQVVTPPGYCTEENS